MRSLKTFFLFLLSTFYSVAQMTPNSTGFYMNWGGINPAHHGLNEHAELFTAFKAQWVGFEGAPKTTNATLSLPFNNRKSDAAMFGMGVTLLNENMASFSNTSLQVAGAVNIQVKNEDRISLGIGIGAVQVGYNADLVSTFEQENNIQRFSSSFLPQFTAGIAFKTKSYIVGLAIDDIGAKNWVSIGTSSSFRTQYSVYGRYLLPLNPNWTLVPSLRISEVFFTPVLYDVMLKLNYADVVNLFVATPSMKGIQFGIGGKIKKVFILNYLFEYGFSPLAQVNMNSHSVGVKIKLNTRNQFIKNAMLLMD